MTDSLHVQEHPAISENRNRSGDEMRHLFAGLVCILIAAGIQMVHSASLSSRPGEAETAFLTRHLIWLAFAAIAGWCASRISPQKLRSHAGDLLIVFLLLLVIVLIPGIGARINGAQRWLRAGSFSMQPSELGRIVLPLVAAARLTQIRSERRKFSLSTLPWMLWPPVIALPLVAKEPDLGATMFLGIGYLLTLFIGGWPFRYFLGCAVLVVPAVASLLILKPYQAQRISGFLAAWQDLNQAPWQVRQSLMSLGSGGLEGTGIGSGWQKLSYLPEANTDFVFAVIGEELGLIGTMTISFLWIAVFFAGTSILKPLPRTSFEWIFGTSLLMGILVQAMANIAVVTAMVPPKGVPHPFISYGGTNLLVSLTAVGLILGMSRSRASQMDPGSSAFSAEAPESVCSFVVGDEDNRVLTADDSGAEHEIRDQNLVSSDADCPDRSVLPFTVPQ
jgi:cell division protein FtsW